MQSSVVRSIPDGDVSRDVGNLVSTPFGDYGPPLANLGYNVFPVVAGTTQPVGGRCYGTSDAEEADAIAAHFPAANIGVDTRELVAIEIEGDAAFDALQRYLPFPEAPVSAIGSIRHVYFAMPGGVPSGQTALPGVRIRSRGSYVLAPPSWLHGFGACRWIRSPWDVWLMPIAPGWLVDLAGGHAHG